MTLRGLFFDLAGVLTEGAQAIPGAVETIDRLRDSKLQLRFVTNTATRSHGELVDELQEMGFQISTHELFTAPMATRQYIQHHHLSPHCLVHPAIAEVFADLESEEPDCVVLGDAREGLTYEALNRAFRIIHSGKPLIGIGLNRYFTEDGQWMLDAGAYIQGLAWATRTEPIITGKPSPTFFAELVNDCGLLPEECLMIGDDVEADIAGAINAGLQGVLVKTGKYQPADLERLPSSASVIDHVRDIDLFIKRLSAL